MTGDTLWTVNSQSESRRLLLSPGEQFRERRVAGCPGTPDTCRTSALSQPVISRWLAVNHLCSSLWILLHCDDVIAHTCRSSVMLKVDQPKDLQTLTDVNIRPEDCFIPFNSIHFSGCTFTSCLLAVVGWRRTGMSGPKSLDRKVEGLT